MGLLVTYPSIDYTYLPFHRHHADLYVVLTHRISYPGIFNIIKTDCWWVKPNVGLDHCYLTHSCLLIPGGPVFHVVMSDSSEEGARAVGGGKSTTGEAAKRTRRVEKQYVDYLVL